MFDPEEASEGETLPDFCLMSAMTQKLRELAGVKDEDLQ